MTFIRSFATLAILSLLALPAHAQQAKKGEGNTFSLLFENDLFFSSDHDYTNGIALAYTTAPDETPGWAGDVARALPFFAQGGEMRSRYAIGQNMFTPRNLAAVNPPLTDRPYAGFLYGSMGVVGPSSLAKESQTFVHGIIADPKPMGWGTQLHDEPGLIIEYERSMKLIRPQLFLGGVFDIEPHYGAAIGNVYDYANIGAMARFGFNLPRDYGPARIQHSLPGSDYSEPTAGLGAYVFAGVDGRAIARNLFLDGNSFVASRSVSKKALVGDVILGAAVVFRSFRVAFTHVLRTRKYKTQSTDSQFGAVSLTARF